MEFRKMMDQNDSGIDITLDELFGPSSLSYDSYLDSINSELIGNSRNNNLDLDLHPNTPSVPFPLDSATLDSGTSTSTSSGFLNPNPFFTTLKSKPIPLTLPETSSGESMTMTPSFKSGTSSSYKCRTQLKMDLQREKALADQRKEAEVRRSLPQHNTTPAVPFSNSLAELTMQMQTPPAVPPQVLKVQTRLENPTGYHKSQIRQKQVLEYLGTSGLGGSVPQSPMSAYIRPPSHIRVQQIHQAVSAPATVQITSPTHGYEFATPSPGPYSSLATSVTSFGSTDDVDDAQLVDSILDMENSDAARLSEILSNLKCSSVDGSTLNPSELKEQKPKRHSKYQAHSSSFEDPSKFDKDRKRKDNHNNIERKRRFNINDRIKDLACLLPKEHELYHKEVGEFRHHKGTILKASVDYITLLKRGEGDRRTADLMLQNSLAQNRKLAQRVLELEQILKANGIPVPKSELSWKPTSADVLNHLIASPLCIKEETDLMPPGTPNNLNSVGVDLMDEQSLARLVSSQDPILTQTLLDAESSQLQDHMDFA